MTSHIPNEVRDRVRASAGERCGYCLSPQHLVFAPLEIEHIIPVAANGSDAEDNLWLACRLCNSHKAYHFQGRDPHSGQIVPLFDPRRQHWSDHFEWIADGTRVGGKTPCGRATVICLQLNNVIAVTVRQNWVAAGWQPPQDE